VRRSGQGLLQKHFYPEPRLALARGWQGTEGLCDELIPRMVFQRIWRIYARPSGVGAKVWAAKIQKVALPIDLQKPGLDPLHLALDGGEDYELLFTVRDGQARHLPRAVRGVPITIIGEVTRSKRILLMDGEGRMKTLRAQGWDPFRKRGNSKRA